MTEIICTYLVGKKKIRKTRKSLNIVFAYIYIYDLYIYKNLEQSLMQI